MKPVELLEAGSVKSHVCHNSLWYTLKIVHAFSDRVLCEFFTKSLLRICPDKVSGTIEDTQNMVDGVEKFHLTVIQNHISPNLMARIPETRDRDGGGMVLRHTSQDFTTCSYRS